MSTPESYGFSTSFVPPISCYVNFLTDESKARIRCVICGLEKVSVDELEAHIAWDHMKWAPYQCGTCPAVFRPTDFTLRVHMQEVHPNEQQKQQQGSEADRRSKSTSESPRISPETFYNSPTSTFPPTANSVIANSLTSQSASTYAPSATFQSQLISSYSLMPTDFNFSSTSETSHSSTADAAGVQYRPRKRPARSYPTNRLASDLSALQCNLCHVVTSTDGMGHVTHVFEHLESSGIGKRYTCGAQRCRFSHYKKGVMTQHCNKAHSGSLSLIQDHTLSLQEEFEKMKNHCFPGISVCLDLELTPDTAGPSQKIPTTNSTTLSSRASLNCAKCGKVVRRELILRHVYEYHLSEKPLKCPYCPYATGYLLFNLRHHVSNCHSDKPMTLIDDREKFQPEVFRLRAECFPIIYQHKTVPGTLQGPPDPGEGDTPLMEGASAQNGQPGGEEGGEVAVLANEGSEMSIVGCSAVKEEISDFT